MAPVSAITPIASATADAVSSRSYARSAVSTIAT